MCVCVVFGFMVFIIKRGDFKNFQLYNAATESTYPIWTGSLLTEQMSTKSMIRSSSLTRSVDFPMVLTIRLTPPRAYFFIYLVELKTTEIFVVMNF